MCQKIGGDGNEKVRGNTRLVEYISGISGIPGMYSTSLGGNC
jgi:hypothetical protein